MPFVYYWHLPRRCALNFLRSLKTIPNQPTTPSPPPPAQNTFLVCTSECISCYDSKYPIQCIDCSPAHGSYGDAENEPEEDEEKNTKARNVKVMLMRPFETFTYRFGSNLENHQHFDSILFGVGTVLPISVFIHPIGSFQMCRRRLCTRHERYTYPSVYAMANFDRISIRISARIVRRCAEPMRA